MPFNPEIKKAGDLITSREWNEAMAEIKRLGDENSLIKSDISSIRTEIQSFTNTIQNLQNIINGLQTTTSNLEEDVSDLEQYRIRHRNYITDIVHQAELNVNILSDL